MGSAYDGTLPNKTPQNFDFYRGHSQGIHAGILAKTIEANKVISGIKNEKLDAVSKLLKIIGAGAADDMRECLEQFGPIRFLENHFCEKE